MARIVSSGIAPASPVKCRTTSTSAVLTGAEVPVVQLAVPVWLVEVTAPVGGNRSEHVPAGEAMKANSTFRGQSHPGRVRGRGVGEDDHGADIPRRVALGHGDPVDPADEVAAGVGDGRGATRPARATRRSAGAGRAATAGRAAATRRAPQTTATRRAAASVAAGRAEPAGSASATTAAAHAAGSASTAAAGGRGARASSCVSGGAAARAAAFHPGASFTSAARTSARGSPVRRAFFSASTPDHQQEAEAENRDGSPLTQEGRHSRRRYHRLIPAVTRPFASDSTS